MLFFLLSGSQLRRFAFFDQHMRLAACKDRIEEVREAIGAAETVRPAEESGEERHCSQNHERHGHRLGRLVDVVLDFMAHARLAVEREPDKTEHVKRSHQRGGVADEPEDAVGAAFRSPRLPEDFVLRKESREWRDSADGERRDQHRPICDRDPLAQVAHVAHVLLTTHRMNYRTRSEEE